MQALGCDVKACESLGERWTKALLRGDFPQQLAQPGTFRNIEGRAQVVLVLAPDPRDLFELCLSRAGEAQGVGTAVVGPGTPLDEALFFELVEHEREAARKRSEQLRERSLGDVGLAAHVPEDPRVRRSQSERRQPLGKARRRMTTDLCEQKSRTRPLGCHCS